MTLLRRRLNTMINALEDSMGSMLHNIDRDLSNMCRNTNTKKDLLKAIDAIAKRLDAFNMDGVQ